MFSLPMLPLFAALLTPSAARVSGQVVPLSGSILSILDFGGKPDGITDTTPALNAAIRAAASKAESVYFPCGDFRFTEKPDAIPTGIQIVGCGSVGSTLGYGTHLVVDYDETQSERGFLEWNGAYIKCCAGTGGGIVYLSISKAAHRAGGTAIKLTGSADGYRAGFFHIDNVLINGATGASWDHDLIVDGLCCTTPGSQGLRDLQIAGLYAASARSGAAAVLFRNAVNVYWQGGKVFPAKSAPTSGITVDGGGSQYSNSSGVHLSDVDVDGDLVINRAQRVTALVDVGGNLTISNSAVDVFVSGLVVGKTVNNSSSAVVVVGPPR